MVCLSLHSRQALLFRDKGGGINNPTPMPAVSAPAAQQIDKRTPRRPRRAFVRLATKTPLLFEFSVLRVTATLQWQGRLLGRWLSDAGIWRAVHGFYLQDKKIGRCNSRCSASLCNLWRRKHAVVSLSMFLAPFRSCIGPGHGSVPSNKAQHSRLSAPTRPRWEARSGKKVPTLPPCPKGPRRENFAFLAAAKHSARARGSLPVSPSVSNG